MGFRSHLISEQTPSKCKCFWSQWFAGEHRRTTKTKEASKEEDVEKFKAGLVSTTSLSSVQPIT